MINKSISESMLFILIQSINQKYQEKEMFREANLSSNSINITKIQESIINQYKRLSFGEETPHYNFDQIYYSEIPNQIPKNIKKNSSHCIILHNYLFYEMVSFAILQYLFVNQNPNKIDLIAKLKKIICAEQFMEGSHYIKGLLLKGIRILSANTEKSKQNLLPVAQNLLKNDCLSAFSECWKEIISKEYNFKEQSQNQPDPKALKILSKFLKVKFDLFWKSNQNTYRHEQISSEAEYDKNVISIIISSTNIVDSIEQKTEKHKNSFPQISIIHGNWIYVLLLQKNINGASVERKSKNIEEKQLSTSKKADKSHHTSEFDGQNSSLQLTSQKRLQKVIFDIQYTYQCGQNLINNFKQFLEELQSTSMEI